MTTLRFLLLEDTLQDTEAIQATLTAGGIEAELLRVDTRADFVTALKTQTFDLILAAYAVPGLDGITALEIALSLRPDVPFIFLSASSGEELAIEALKRGATDYVLKQRLGRLVPCVQRALREVQERQRSQAALRQLEAKNRTLFESIDEGFCICKMLFDAQGNPHDYRFLEVNPLFETMTGLKHATGKTALELVPTLEAVWFETYGSVVLTGKPVRFEQQAVSMRRWFTVNAFRLGEPQSHQFAVLFTDISARKKVEQERDRFLAIGSDLQVITGSNGSFQWVSPTFERVLGWTVEEMTAHSWTEFVHPDDLGKSVLETNCLVSSSETVEFENRYRHKDGSYRWFLWHAQPYPVEQVFYGVAVDITDRKRAELNAEFLANVSQDLVEAIDVEAIVQTVADRLNRYLNTSICAFVEINETKDEAVIHHAWHQHDVPSLVGVYPLPEFVSNEFLQAAKAGQAIVVRNVATDPRIADQQKFAALKIGSFINIPFIRDGVWKFALGVYHQTPYNWRTDEIALMRELSARIWNRLERTRAEATLRASEQQLRAIYDGTHEHIGLLTPDGTLLETNRASLEFGDCQREAVVGLPFWETVWFQHTPNLLEAVQQAVERAAAGKFVRFEASIVNPTGETRTFDLSFYPICNETGKVILIVPEGREITERKRIEVALRDSEEQFRHMANNAPFMVWVTDPTGSCTYLSQSWYDFTGQTPEASLGFGWLDRTHPDDRETAKQLFLEANQRQEGFRLEYRLQHRDGAYIWAIDAASPWFGTDGQFKGYVGSVIDITDRKAAEAAREQLLQQEQAAREVAEHANRIKDEFLAVLSHELRTPLNPILGWARLLQQGKLDAAKTTVAIATIERNAKLQSQLIEDLLDLSRILQGKMSLSALPVDLSTVIAAALETVRLAAETKAIQIQTVVSPAVAQVIGDAGRLQQVVWNLLANAIKFTPQGGHVTLMLSQVGNHAQMQIMDTGKGIRADFLPYVFEHFRQEDGATTRQFGGLGLGLAIVQQIVELHGGTVTVSSSGEGLGATFTVQLPLAPRLTEALTLERSPVSESDLSGVHVLIVDDETDSREFIAFVLEQAHASVTIAASGIEALQALSQAIPDIIISDIGMPEMDGYMLIHHVRSLPLEQGGQIPAIALTAYAGEVDQQQAIAAGFQHHIAKPIDPEAVTAIIVELVASAQSWKHKV